MAERTPSRGNAWALLGLAIFVEIMAVLALAVWGAEITRRGIPVWILGVLLVPFGLWLGYRGVKGLRS
jgi:hypothetical protein